jgi:hypothetical protein
MCAGGVPRGTAGSVSGSLFIVLSHDFLLGLGDAHALTSLRRSFWRRPGVPFHRPGPPSAPDGHSSLAPAQNHGSGARETVAPRYRLHRLDASFAAFPSNPNAPDTIVHVESGVQCHERGIVAGTLLRFRIDRVVRTLDTAKMPVRPSGNRGRVTGRPHSMLERRPAPFRRRGRVGRRPVVRRARKG